MFLIRFYKFIHNLFLSVESLNRQVNHYKIVSKEPAIPSYAYINWGLYLINSGKKEKGIEKLKQSVLMNKSNPEVYLNLGIAYAQDSNYDEALKNFRKAVRLDKNNARAWGYLAGIYAELDDKNYAKSAFEKSLKLDRTNPITYYNYGVFSVKNNQKEMAISLFKKAYILDPMNVQPLLMWGIILLQEEEYKSANEIKRAINKLTTSISQSQKWKINDCLIKLPYEINDIWIADLKYDFNVGLMLNKDDEYELDERFFD